MPVTNPKIVSVFIYPPIPVRSFDMEARFLATDIRNLTEDLNQIKAWIGHWQEDVAANLKPTTESLDAAMHRVKTCIRTVESIRTIRERLMAEAA